MSFDNLRTNLFQMKHTIGKGGFIARPEIERTIIQLLYATEVIRAAKLVRNHPHHHHNLEKFDNALAQFEKVSL